jgi:hypothetical protein
MIKTKSDLPIIIIIIKSIWKSKSVNATQEDKIFFQLLAQWIFEENGTNKYQNTARSTARRDWYWSKQIKSISLHGIGTSVKESGDMKIWEISVLLKQRIRCDEIAGFADDLSHKDSDFFFVKSLF